MPESNADHHGSLCAVVRFPYGSDEEGQCIESGNYSRHMLFYRTVTEAELIFLLIKKNVGSDPGCCQRFKIVLVGPCNCVLFSTRCTKPVCPCRQRLDLLHKQ